MDGRTSILESFCDYLDQLIIASRPAYLDLTFKDLPLMMSKAARGTSGIKPRIIGKRSRLKTFSPRILRAVRRTRKVKCMVW